MATIRNYVGEFVEFYGKSAMNSVIQASIVSLTDVSLSRRGGTGRRAGLKIQ